ncbi:MAG TPA: MFS transporter [Pseudonocardiaceae bacterium]|nr:MFS transporter [Pseudonocardiaceae bacterium]
MPVGLIALAIGGFGIGLTEIIIAGLLPQVANDFTVSIPTAGLLISGYALSVALGALLLTAAVTRLPRKTVLLGLMVLFILGNLISAIAPTFGIMMIGRVVAALCHGAFFGIGSVVAADLVAPEKKAGAISIMFAGLTTANVLGVPLGTLLGQHFGWRATFWAITAIGVVAFFGIVALVPSTVSANGSARLRGELHAFRGPQVLLSLAVTVLGFGGMFGAFTYITPMMTDVAGFASSNVTWLLIVFGIGLFLGNLAGGKAADRALTPSLVVLLIALAVVLGALTFTAHAKIPAIITLLLMGAFGFAIVPGLQMRVLHYASDAPTMASSANIAAFNVGNALGAYLGGRTIAAGFGYTSPAWVGALLTVAALAVLLVATALARRNRAETRELVTVA